MHTYRAGCNRRVWRAMRSMTILITSWGSKHIARSGCCPRCKSLWRKNGAQGIGDSIQLQIGRSQWIRQRWAVKCVSKTQVVLKESRTASQASARESTWACVKGMSKTCKQKRSEPWVFEVAREMLEPNEQSKDSTFKGHTPVAGGNQELDYFCMANANETQA